MGVFLAYYRGNEAYIQWGLYGGHLLFIWAGSYRQQSLLPVLQYWRNCNTYCVLLSALVLFNTWWWSVRKRNMAVSR